MLKHIIIAATLVFSTTAHAVEIEALGTGTASAPSVRTQIMFGPLSDDKTLEALAAKDVADARTKLLAAIKRVDPSVKHTPNAKMPAMGGLESLMALAGPPEAFEIASSKAVAVKDALSTTYGTALSPLLTPVAGDQSALKREALKLAIADAKVRAADLAGAAGLKLGPMVRVREGTPTENPLGALGGLGALMAMGAKDDEKPKDATASASVLVTFDAAP